MASRKIFVAYQWTSRDTRTQGFGNAMLEHKDWNGITPGFIRSIEAKIKSEMLSDGERVKTVVVLNVQEMASDD